MDIKTFMMFLEILRVGAGYFKNMVNDKNLKYDNLNKEMDTKEFNQKINRLENVSNSRMLEGILSYKTKKDRKRHECSQENNDNKTSNRYKNAAVTTEVPLCSALGVRILQMGGNALDAAVAATICVGIINSFSSGLGGGGFMLIKFPENEKKSNNHRF